MLRAPYVDEEQDFRICVCHHLQGAPGECEKERASDNGAGCDGGNSQAGVRLGLEVYIPDIRQMREHPASACGNRGPEEKCRHAQTHPTDQAERMPRGQNDLHDVTPNRYLPRHCHYGWSYASLEEEEARETPRSRHRCWRSTGKPVPGHPPHNRSRMCRAYHALPSRPSTRPAQYMRQNGKNCLHWSGVPGKTVALDMVLKAIEAYGGGRTRPERAIAIPHATRAIKRVRDIRDHEMRSK
ncbi:hypothetical protein BH160DRAFT_1911 [Burkholderia sp. H160]|nr:hypothetical protein BH160DRAFT_1911 [Burkholderia sp. H160]